MLQDSVATRPELDEPPGADPVPDHAAGLRRGAHEVAQEGALTGLVGLVFDTSAVGLERLGAKELRPLAREQRGVHGETVFAMEPVLCRQQGEIERDRTGLSSRFLLPGLLGHP